MKSKNAYSHLTLEERRIILAGIKNGSTKAAIAPPARSGVWGGAPRRQSGMPRVSGA